MCKDAEKKRKKEKDAARPGVSGEERGKKLKSIDSSAGALSEQVMY